MQAPTRSKFELHLPAAVERVRLLETQDEDEAWGCIADALAWLYRAEQAEKNVEGYWRDRDASVDGQSLGGLIWYRGLVEHHTADVRALVWHRVEMSVWNGMEWVPTRSRVWTGTEWQETETKVPHWSWPEVDSSEKDPHKGGRRDAWYRERVQNEPVIAPLQAAARFLLDR